MKLSELKASNSGFEKLTCTVKVDGRQLYPGALSLSRMHIDTTCELKTNTAEVLFCDITDAGEVLSNLQSGACLWRISEEGKAYFSGICSYDDPA